MRFFDGKRGVEIKMKEWDNRINSYGSDMSEDCFDGPVREYAPLPDAYLVPDVEAYIQYAEDWKNYHGEFADDKEFYEVSSLPLPYRDVFKTEFFPASPAPSPLANRVPDAESRWVEGGFFQRDDDTRPLEFLWSRDYELAAEYADELSGRNYGVTPMTNTEVEWQCGIGDFYINKDKTILLFRQRGGINFSIYYKYEDD